MIQVLSPHERRFQGRVYRRDPRSKWSSVRKYFKPSLADMRSGVRALHVEVFKHHRGPIPAGFQVHHRKGNTNRNRLRDLALVGIATHKGQHKVTDPGRLQAIREHLARIRPVKGSEFHTRGLARRARRKRRAA